MTVDLRDTIVAKSDQMNSDDLLGGPITIKIRDVTKKDGAADQPINIFYEGDNNKPWKPCKSMRRILVSLWGHEGKAYIGRSLTLYRDEKVLWGGEPVGGIRISHMSHLEEERTLPLTAARGSKKKVTVKPLRIQSTPAGGTVKPETEENPIVKAAGKIRRAIALSPDLEDLFKVEVDFAEEYAVIAGTPATVDFLKKEFEAKKTELENM